MAYTEIGPQYISLNDVENILTNQIELSQDAIQNILHCRAYLDKKISTNNQTFYGINTGFGSLCDVKI